MLGISKSHLCDIEKGRKIASLGRAVRFAEALGYLPASFAQLALQDLVNRAGLELTVQVKTTRTPSTEEAVATGG